MKPEVSAVLVILMAIVCAFIWSGSIVRAEDPVAFQPAQASDPWQKTKLGEATMCERVDNLNPTRPGVVFSVSAGQVCCFTSFDPVPQPTLIYHRWYHRDELSTQTKLRIYPPRWATYSVIQLRETDKGPWRVEVTDQAGNIFSILRFSIAD